VEDWKVKALRIIPPWLALGVYRDLLLEFARFESKSFSVKKVERYLSREESDNQQRLMRVLPTAAETLVKSGLLVESKDQSLREGDDFRHLLDFTEGVQSNTQKVVRWAVYYTISNGHYPFTSETVAEILVPPFTDTSKMLDELTLWSNGKDVRLLQRHNGKWKIKEGIRIPRTSPSITADVCEKLVHAVCVIAKSKREQLDASEIFAEVRSLDAENCKRFFRRLKFVEQKDGWRLPESYTAQMLIHKIESRTRLQTGRALEECIKLLDKRSLSGTEIATITEIDKSTISKTLRKLDEENLIIRSDEEEPLGEKYYTTNCHNCYFKKDVKLCHKDAMKKINDILESLRGATRKTDFGEISNQTLNRIKDDLINMKTDKTSKNSIQELASAWHALLEPEFAKIINKIVTRFSKMASSKSWPPIESMYQIIKEENKDLPVMYVVALRHVMNCAQVKRGLELYSKEKATERYA
jgi:predicted transcriptional regulator